MKQAVVYYLCGFTFEKIGKQVGRSERTMRDWTKTRMWEEMVDEVMLDKLMMTVVDMGLAAQDVAKNLQAATIPQRDPNYGGV